MSGTVKNHIYICINMILTYFFSSHNQSVHGLIPFYYHFTEAETEAWRGQATCLNCPASKWQSQSFISVSLAWVCVFNGDVEPFILLDGSAGKQSARLRRCVFNPWVRKIPWRRKCQPTAVYLPEKSHGQGSLMGYSPKGHKELDMTEWLSICI